MHRLRIEYFEQGGEERLDLEIEGPDWVAHQLRSWSNQPGSHRCQGNRATSSRRWLLCRSGKSNLPENRVANCHSLKIGERELTSALNPPPLNSLKSAGGCLAVRCPQGCLTTRSVPVSAARSRGASGEESAVELIAAKRTDLGEL